MNNKIALKILVLSLLVCCQLNAQLSTREVPVSFKYNLTNEIPTISMPAINIEELLAEDEIEAQQGIPPRFGYAHSVNINLTEVGLWQILSDSSKICQLKIVCSGALSINLLYDKYWLPEGAKLFIYSNNKKQHIGAFTSKNNRGTKYNVEGFATGLVYKDTSVVEYYVPKDCFTEGIIIISGVVHGYKYINLLNYGEAGYGPVPDNMYNRSGPCQVNINCEEGANWQNEKRAVAYGGNGFEPLGGYTYRLTDSGDAFRYSIVAMWHK